MSACESCGGTGVLIVLDWAYDRLDDRPPVWHENEPYPSSCHCPAGAARGLL